MNYHWPLEGVRGLFAKKMIKDHCITLTRQDWLVVYVFHSLEIWLCSLSDLLLFFFITLHCMQGLQNMWKHHTSRLSLSSDSLLKTL